MPAENSAVRTVNRISAILNCFTREEPVLSLASISHALNLPKSTCHRLLTALESQGFLTRDSSGKGYRLGYQLIYWGMLAQTTISLRQEALPILRKLCKATGETAILSVRDGNVGICLEMVESSQPVRLTMQVGRRIMLHAGASSKVLWAFLPEDEVREILTEITLVPLQINTITDRDRLYQELMAIRDRGYATSFEETDAGAMGIAAPVYDHSGRPVAGIGIAVPISRLPPERVPLVAPLVVEAASRLSLRLGAPAAGIHTQSLGDSSSLSVAITPDQGQEKNGRQRVPSVG